MKKIAYENPKALALKMQYQQIRNWFCLVLRLWHVFTVGMEAILRISCIVDNLELASLVVVTIPE